VEKIKVFLEFGTMVDKLLVTDRLRQPTDSLRDLLAGVPTFLVGGGPSMKTLDLSQLSRRGVWSMGINNVAGHVRTNAFVCSDPPSKFHDGIWLDPSILKFVPIPKLSPKRGRSHLRTKRDGMFSQLIREGRQWLSSDCPNVWGFERRSWWAFDDTFFTEESAAWGNGGKVGTKKTGNPTVFNTLLLGMRLLYYLGSRRIFLVGVDFKMTDTSGYAFNQGRTREAVESNNAQYRNVNDGLDKMAKAGVFERAGLEIFNCNPMSSLRAFPYVEFNAAVANALKGFPAEPLDLSGWYEK
jgi:hypothetical protein